MKYALDTEFIEDGKTIDLLSIGIVAQDGRELYLQSRECDRSKANSWVRENVLPNLEHLDCGREKSLSVCKLAAPCPWRQRFAIAASLIEFCDREEHGKPEFWTYYGDYDWVAVCQLFGTMTDLPKGWPMLAYDLRQMLDFQGHSDITQPDDMPHHALSDARWIMETLKSYERRG